MAPNLTRTSTIVLTEPVEKKNKETSPETTAFLRSTSKKQEIRETFEEAACATLKHQDAVYQREIVWRNVLGFIYLHSAAFYGLYLMFTDASIKSVIFTIVCLFFGGFGITAGAHRLWAHRSYKAKWSMRLVLAIFQTLAFQNHIYEWVRDHRVHHKFSDTNADPHNATRGFFFSHMGWLMVKKHPDVINKGKLIDLSDLERDGIVMFQKRFYLFLMPFICFFLPSVIPWALWNENFFTAYYLCVARYIFSLHGTWLVNSAAHFWGNKPYDKSIIPADNFSVAVLAFGEGWHNYHHVFPYDYKTSELGKYSTNLTTMIIDFCSTMGLAYDLKTVPIDVINRRSLRTGDGTRPQAQDTNTDTDANLKEEVNVWGWGDQDMQPEEISRAEIINRSQ